MSISSSAGKGLMEENRVISLNEHADLTAGKSND